MNRLVAAAGILGFLTVALGAFGAHALAGRLSGDAQNWWHTATLYAVPHAAAALAAGLATQEGGQRSLLRTGGWAFVIGSVIFASSLYAMALGAPRWMGAITPLGGISLLVGWILCGLSARRS